MVAIPWGIRTPHFPNLPIKELSFEEVFDEELIESGYTDSTEEWYLEYDLIVGWELIDDDNGRRLTPKKEHRRISFTKKWRQYWTRTGLKFTYGERVLLEDNTPEREEDEKIK